MDLEEYFTTRQGTGTLSTADRQGEVDAAIYARPHLQADGTLAMIMRDRLTHCNLQENPHAVYLSLDPYMRGRILCPTCRLRRGDGRQRRL
ncbi:hypothetical protein JCM30471_29480 [Desulfuromonas carbonis]|uniref:pyridoxamine 5'-phosphate oxidase family protein n=1 Tax=Desulfuromonas sp. DDH964 TaxID=1823759 RepID=UPI00078BEF3A|nr:pyridoxamine 5'-phosphate oxidase family protein [Desulfuromonas sp. DDH964]AMV71126.1 pyridoxamine 5'-phosphate oxidase [Desulfuromonas sp. DDH964]